VKLDLATSHDVRALVAQGRSIE